MPLTRHRSGGLGTLKIRPIQIELMPGAKPYHHRAYPIPKSLEVTTKKEIKPLEGLEVLRKTNDFK